MRPRRSADETATLSAIRLACQEDVYALAVLLNNDRGTQNALTPPFHLPICRFAQSSPFKKNLYLVPRGFFKTSLLTVARNVQRILLNPEIRILIGSNKAENAEAMLREIKGALQNPWLIEAFPDILYPDPARQAEQWTNSAITVKRKRRAKEATIETIGVSGEVTSKHYDHATFDDVVGKENSQTREGREDTIGFIRAAESLLDPGATEDFIGTPWHYADAYAWLEEQKVKHGMELGIYKRACWEPDPQGALAGPFGRVRPTFPERFPVKELLAIRATKGPSEFAAQYLMDPVSADTAYFPREKLLPNILHRRELPPPDTLWLVMTVDPAISMKAWADFSAIGVVGWDAKGLMYILDLSRGRWAESELVNRVYDAYARYPDIKAIGFEAVGFQKLFRNEFQHQAEQRGQFLPIVSLERDTRITKNVRLRALEPIWHAGELYMASDVDAKDDFIEEAARYRPDRENAHDDMLDCVVDAIQLRLRPGMAEPDTGIEDAELLERMQLEDRIQRQRAEAMQRPLDRTSLRAATMQAQRMARLEEENEAMAGATSPYGDFV